MAMPAKRKSKPKKKSPPPSGVGRTRWDAFIHIFEAIGPAGQIIILIMGLTFGALYANKQNQEINEAAQKSLLESSKHTAEMSTLIISNVRDLFDTREKLGKDLEDIRKEVIEEKRKASDIKLKLEYETKKVKQKEGELKKIAHRLTRTQSALDEQETALQTSQEDAARVKQDLRLKTLEVETVSKEQQRTKDQLAKLEDALKNRETALRYAEKKVANAEKARRIKVRELKTTDMRLAGIDRNLRIREEELRKAEDEIAKRKEQARKRERQTQRALAARTQQIVELKREIERLAKAKVAEATAGDTAGTEKAKEVIAKIIKSVTLRPDEILKAFASNSTDPKAQENLKKLVGITTSEITPVLRQQKGFALWGAYTEKGKSEPLLFLGLLTLASDLYQGTIYLTIEDGKVVDVEFDLSRRYLVRVPNERNWLKTWLAVLWSESSTSWYDVFEGNNILLSELADLTDEKTNFDILSGEDGPMKIISIEELKMTQNQLFQKFSKQSDYRGRPSINIAMYQRSKVFDPNLIVSPKTFAKTVGLRERFTGLLKAAVEKDVEAANAYLAVGLDDEIVGRIGAIVLSDRFRILHVVPSKRFARKQEASAEGVLVEAPSSPAPAESPPQSPEPIPEISESVGSLTKATIKAEFRERAGDRRAKSVDFHFGKQKDTENWILFDLVEKVQR